MFLEPSITPFLVQNPLKSESQRNFIVKVYSEISVKAMLLIDGAEIGYV